MNTLTWLYLPTAFALGMAHALEPGHSKAVLASYLVSIKGRPRDAVVLGLTVTFTHTIVIFLLAAGAVLLGPAFPMQEVQHWLEAISAAIVTVMGLWLLRSRWLEWRHERDHERAHATGQHHEHHHDHSHELPSTGQRPSWRQLVMFGLSGGVVPCPGALALLLLAVGIGQPTLGLVTVIVFSAGLALTLVVLGIAVCRGVELGQQRFLNSGWVKRLPLISAGFVTALGIAMMLRTLLFSGHAHQPNRKELP